MARQINDIHDFIQFIERKQRLAIQSHPEIDDALDAGQMDSFTHYHNIFLATGKLPDALLPFKTDYTFTYVGTPGGLITMPTDNIQTVKGNVVVYDNKRNVPVKRKITFVDETELIDALNSQLRPVSAQRPIAINNNTAIQLYPATGQAGLVTYLKRPATPVYAYTQVGRVITYNAVGSTQLQWADLYLDNVIAKTLPYLGINLNSPEITQFAMMKDKETA